MCRGKHAPDKALPVPCQRPAFLWRQESAHGMWNLECALEPGTVASFSLQTTLIVGPGSSNPKSQAITGEGRPRQPRGQEEFPWHRGLAGGYPCMPRISIKLAHGGFRLWGRVTLTQPSGTNTCVHEPRQPVY